MYKKNTFQKAGSGKRTTVTSKLLSRILLVNSHYIYKGKGKVIPSQARCGPEVG